MADMKMDREKAAEEYSKEQQKSANIEVILFIAGIFLLIGAFVVAALGLVAWTIFSMIMGSLFVFLGYVLPELREYLYSHVYDEKKD